VQYLTNHDEQRLLVDLAEVAKTFEEAAFRRSKLGASLLLTAPGIPMILMGEEFGQPTPKSMGPQPLIWELLDNPINNGLFQHYAFLIKLRKANPAFTSLNFAPVFSDRERGLLAYRRWNDAGNVAVVVANLRDAHTGEFTIAEAGLEDGRWHEMVYNYDVCVEGGRLVDTLGESEVKIYVREGVNP
jgi:1,4-alpha-glucan branching enzyme